MRRFTKIQTRDRLVNLIQRNLETFFTQFILCYLLDGKYYTETVTYGDNTIDHGLSRSIKGFIVVDTSREVSTYKVSSTDNSITLFATGDAVISLWIF